MGIIQRQAAKHSIAGFIGTAIAAISTLFIYPLELDSYGLAVYILMTAAFFSAFASFGSPAVVVKFFPAINRDVERGPAFLFNVLLLSHFAFAIFLSLALLLKPQIYAALESLNFNVPLIRKYAAQIFFLTYVLVLTTIFIQHASNHQRIVIPDVLYTLVPKIVLPSLLLMVHAAWIGEEAFVRFWILSHILICIAMILYLARLKALSLIPRVILFREGLIKKMLSYATFTGLSTMGNVLVNRIDVIMVATLLGTKEAGYYAIALFISNIIGIPTRAIWSISAPILSDAWERKDMPRISRIYQKSAVNLLVIGFFLFFLLYGSLNDIFSLSPRQEELAMCLPIFFWLGIAKLINMGTSVNTQIIIFSEKYRYNLVFVLLVGVFNAALNYTLINAMGVQGAALATAISVASVNLLSLVFVAWQFRLLPFDQRIFKVVLLGIIAWGVYAATPALDPPVLHMLVYGVLLSILYIGVALLLNVSPDLAAMGKSYLNRFMGLWK